MKSAAAWGLVAVVSLAAPACSGDDAAIPPADVPAAATEQLVRGPLCDVLPQPGQPGGPDLLATERADVALTWIPVGTTFEAGTRATGLNARLRTAQDVTILVPTDDAFDAAFSDTTMDELLISRRKELRPLLEYHIIEGSYSAAELVEVGRVTTLSGGQIVVSAAEGGMARFDDRAETICADYGVDNAGIHVIDGVLGKHPEPAATDEPHIG